MKSLAILQNADFEGPGALPEWALAEGFAVRIYRAFEGELPEVDSFSHLVVLGTPHSVHDIPGLPWLLRERNLVRAAVAGARSVLGICFGAQLLADLFGGEVKVGDRAEIGWFPFPSAPWPAGYSAVGQGDLFQWHREHFSLPPGCDGLGVSGAGYLAGFSRGPRVLGISGHLEITPALVDGYIACCWSDASHAEDLARGAGAFRQAPDVMRALALRDGQVDFAGRIFRAWLSA